MYDFATLVPLDKGDFRGSNYAPGKPKTRGKTLWGYYDIPIVFNVHEVEFDKTEEIN